MLKLLLPKIPPHVCYCEPFAGGLAVLMAKPRSDVEVINDINNDLITLYRCIQYHPAALREEITHLIASRVMLQEFRKHTGVTDIQRAARFYYRNRISFAGTGTSLGIAKTKGGGCSFPLKTQYDLLGQAGERLDGVVVENVPYERCLSLYDSPDTFFFLDPPYLNADPGAYAGWTEADLRQFRTRIDTLTGRWMITLDDSPLVRDLFQGCRLQPVVTQNRCVNQRLNPKTTFGELIITSD